MKLDNATVFITGANRGLGLAFAREALARGARKVYAAARDPSTVKLPGVIPIRLDVTRQEDIEAAALACGDVTVLINNAGIAATGGFLAKDAVASAQRHLDTNLFGPMRLTQAFAPILAAHGGGAILNASASSAVVTTAPGADFGTCCRSQAGSQDRRLPRDRSIEPARVQRMRYRLLLCTALLLSSCGSDDDGPTVSFFVSSATSATGNLGGLAGADATCQRLATAVGRGGRTWRAYLSADRGPDGQPVNARDRIGQGPWYNTNLELVAANLTELHARTGNATVFIDELGRPINGQWTGSPTPVEHDILTGSNGDGTLLPGATCASWTSAGTDVTAQVGHSDGLGPNQNATPPLSSWNSAHAALNCSNTAPRGGAGRIYCFAP